MYTSCFNKSINMGADKVDLYLSKGWEMKSASKAVTVYLLETKC